MRGVLIAGAVIVAVVIITHFGCPICRQYARAWTGV